MPQIVSPMAAGGVKSYQSTVSTVEAIKPQTMALYQEVSLGATLKGLTVPLVLVQVVPPSVDTCQTNDVPFCPERVNAVLSPAQTEAGFASAVPAEKILLVA